ncbi:MAG: bifunctional diaminohydroxyphosphoribosylaminopyrimidine deaminase/5-amino-6-(5-phosphoribosylamino)uracil reductase RibD [Paramuribaculum sp.]|nr:bifunctional diaminohydroxyphosphoribosylaminopyrimidine deaminase/5-amino-6-(5-phosphoribosylamino)uracil reductase RibD [Paramuribaculum sp.]
MTVDSRFMARAVEIARGGLGNVSPNPMVGAVIVNDGRIIGEGYHRKYGGPHAEVNAIASVAEADRPLLANSTIYVTLEPCSHYGKTPPCADLIIATGIPRVVVGCMDPFVKVSGRGVAKLRAAGIEVVTGILEDECRELNKVFMTAHTLSRPYITLKWAQSRDGFIGAVKDGAKVPVRFSTAASAALVHAMRARHDAIMVGAGTAVADNPRLDVRLFCGNNPVKVILDRSGKAFGGCRSMTGRVLYFSNVSPQCGSVEWIECKKDAPLDVVLGELYHRGITSVLVEGGAALLQSFMESGCWDEARVEIAPFDLAPECGVPAPYIKGMPASVDKVDGNFILGFRNK